MRKSARTAGRNLASRRSLRNAIATTRPVMDMLEVRRLLSTTWTVDDDAPADFTTIQDAINSTLVINGDTISVQPGSYGSPGVAVSISKQLTLQGSGAANTAVAGGMLVTAANVTIDGFAITGGASATLGELYGVGMYFGATNTTISNNIITGPGTGTIPGTGVLSTYGAGNDSLEITGNTITNWHFGIYNQTNTGVTVSGNTLGSVNFGIGNDSIQDLVISGNTISGFTQIGIEIYQDPGNAETVTITGNNIPFAHPAQSVVTQNGTSLGDSITLTGNTFTQQATGGSFLGTGSDVTLGSNNFVIELNEDSLLDVDLDLDGSGLDAVIPIAGTGAGKTNGTVVALPTPPFTVVRYTPTANYANSPATRGAYEFNLGSDAPGANRTVTIIVNEVNDAPTFTQQNASITVLEDSGSSTFTVANSIVLGPGGAALDAGNEGTQAGSFVLSAQSNPGLFSVAPSISPSGSLSFTPAPDAFGSSTFTAFLQDSGGIANGGVDSSGTVTYTITVTPVNDAPVANDDDYTSLGVTEDTTSASLPVQSNDTDPDNTFPLAITHINGNPITVGVPFTLPTGAQVTLNPDGTLAYNASASAALNALSAGAFVDEVFVYTLSDGALSDTATVTVRVNGVNDNPTVTGGTTYSINENSTTPFGAFTGSDVDVLNSLTYAIGSSPTGPFAASAAVALGTFAINASPTNGNPASLSITPSGVNYEASASKNAVLYIRATDNDGGTHTFGPVTVTVNDVNEPIAVAVPSAATISFAEDSTFTFGPAVANTFSISDPDNHPNNSNVFNYTVTVTASSGTLTLAGSTGTPTSRTLTGTSLAAINAALAGMTYTPPANFPGTAATGAQTLTISAFDGANNAGPSSKTVTVVQDNDAPTVSPSTFAGTFTEPVSPAPGVPVDVFPSLTLADVEGNSIRAVTITSTNWVNGQDGLTFPATPPGFTFTYNSATGAASLTGGTATLAVIQTYLRGIQYSNSSDDPTTAPNRFISVTVQDNGTGNGTSGTANNFKTSSAVTSTISVVASNDPPVAVDDAFLAIEDLPLTSVNVKNNNGFGADSDPDTPLASVVVNQINGTPVSGATTYTITAAIPAGDFSGVSSGGQALINGLADRGTVVINPDGSFTYNQNGRFDTLPAGSTAKVKFTYRLNDGSLNSNIATVTITIAGVNDAPVANNDGAYSVSEDGPVLSVPAAGILGNDTDVDDGSALTAVSVTYSGGGTLVVNPNGSFTFDPGNDYQHLDDGEFVNETFTYRASDGITTSNLATVTITINGANDAPVFSPTSYTFSVAENASVPVGSVSATDVDIEPLTYSIVSPTLSPFSINPSTGQISANGTQDFEVQNSYLLIVQVSDGTASAPTAATVTINVTNVNEAPITGNDTLTVSEDGPAGSVNVLTNDYDPDVVPITFGAGLTVTVVSSPAGLVSTDGTNVTFSPNGEFESLAQGTSVVVPVTYTVNDGSAPSATGTVFVTVNGQNDAPTVVNPIPDQFGDQDTPFSYTFPSNTFADVDAGTTLVYGATGVPSWLTFNPSTRTFNGTPGAADTGDFTITVTASDGIAAPASDTFVISIIDDFNDPPIASPGGTLAVLNEDSSITVDVITGALGGPGAESSQTVFLNPILVSPPSHGSFFVNAVTGTIQYIPNPNYFGPDSLVYRIADSGLPTAQTDVTLNITVNPVNDAPSFSVGGGFGNQTVDEDSALTVVPSFVNVPINVGPANESGQSASFVLNSSTPGAFDVLDIDELTGALSFKPAADVSGTFTITVFAQDDGGIANGGVDTSAPVTFIIVVNEVDDDPPVANNDTYALNEAGVVGGNVITTGAGADTDPDTPVASLTITHVNGLLLTSYPLDGGGPARLVTLSHGVLSIAPNGAFTYTHNGNDATVDSFTYQITDGTNPSNVATATFNISNVTPSVNAGADTSIAQAVALTGRTFSFADPGLEGTWTVTINWGDGSPIQTLVPDPTAPGVYVLPDHVFLTTGVKTVTIFVNDGEATGSDSFDVTVTPNPFAVTAFTPTESGFNVTFNRAFDPSVLNLYGTATLGSADVVVLLGGVPQKGSLVFTGASTLSWVRTGGPLASGTYSLTLRSASDGFKDLFGLTLDGGVGDSIPGGEYTRTFSPPDGTGVVLSVPDFARGPGQSATVYSATAVAQVPLPVRISDGTGVYAIDFVLDFDPSLLTVTSITLSAGVPGDWSILTIPSVGSIIVQAFGITPLSAGAQSVFDINATVAAGAPYLSAGKLVVRDVEVNENFIDSRGDEAVHSVVFAGDATGNGGTTPYSSLDASRIAQVAIGLLDGFVAHPVIDPAIVGDVNSTGTLSSFDASLVAQEAIGIDRIEIPPIPGARVGSTWTAGHADGLITPTRLSVGPDGLVSLTVGINRNRSPNAEAAMMFNLSYDPGVLRISGANAVTLTAWAQSRGLSVVVNAETPGTIRVALFGPMPLGAGLQDLIAVSFQPLARPSTGLTRVLVSGVDEGANRHFAERVTEVVFGKSVKLQEPWMLSNDREREVFSQVLIG